MSNNPIEINCVERVYDTSPDLKITIDKSGVLPKNNKLHPKEYRKYNECYDNRDKSNICQGNYKRFGYYDIPCKQTQYNLPNYYNQDRVIDQYFKSHSNK